MPEPTDSVEIKEPPLQELTKRRSLLPYSCLTALGSVAVFLLACFVILRLTATTPVTEIKKVPDDTQAVIPIYDEKNIVKITQISGKPPSRALEIAAIIPKFTLSALLAAAEQGPALPHLLRQPLTDERDRLLIEWTDLSATPRFIEDYYTTALQKRQFTINLPLTIDDVRQFSFHKDGYDGTVSIKQDASKTGTAYFTILLYFPSPAR